MTITTIQAQGSICPDGTPGISECEYLHCHMCTLNGYVGSTAGYGPDPDGDLVFLHFCGTSESVQYFSFVAGAAQFTITVTVSGCSVISGIDMAIMPGCDVNVIACSPGNGTNTNVLSVQNLTVGNLYTFILDVDASSDCDFTITTNPAYATAPPNIYIPPNLTLSGDFAVCPHAITEYQLEPVTFLGEVVWTAPAGTLINDQAPPVTVNAGDPVNVEWGTSGGNICAVASNECFESNPACHNVTITPIPPTILPPVTICAEETPYELPWGVTVNNTNTYSVNIPSYQGCDSTLMMHVTVLPAIVHQLPSIPLCPGDCVTFCGEQFCGTGTYMAHCQAANGCDSTIQFSIIEPNLVANILGGSQLTCNILSLSFGSANSQGIKTWQNLAGQMLGSGDSLVVHTPGTYILSVSTTIGGHTCSRFDTLVVTSDIAIPPILATGVTIGCDTLPSILHATSPVNPAQYTWSGPNGFSSNQQNPQISALGAYFVTITNPANGCVNRDTVFALPCCALFAGTFDSTLLEVCSNKNLIAGFHHDSNLMPGDTIIFVLYSNPADPLGSTLMSMPTPVFPFIPGLTYTDSLYFVAAFAAQLLPDHSIYFSGSCVSLSPGEPVVWRAAPTIALNSAPNAICTGVCLDVFFQFTGTAPFQFHYDVTQNGQIIYSQDVISDALQKMLTICPQNFDPPVLSGNLGFNVNFLQDIHCTCGN